MPQFPTDEEFERLLKSGGLPDIPESTSGGGQPKSEAADPSVDSRDVTSAATNPDIAALESVANEMKASLQSIQKTLEDLNSMLKKVMDE
tara:strand:+ start:1909 stop:2178 length:270 start_codon:yes stop_codon:yes gene_type:complete